MECWKWASVRAMLRRPQGAPKYFWLLNALSMVTCCTGYLAASLLTRYYFQEGGSLRWLQTLVMAMGFPICIPIQIVACWKQNLRYRVPGIRLCAIYLVLGIILTADNLMYAWGLSYLPASTAGMLISTQLAFTCVFSLIIIRQKISAPAWNSIVLVIFSSIILALTSASDTLTGVSSYQHNIGFAYTLGAAALYGLFLPLIQLLYIRVYQKVSLILILELQIAMALVQSVICFVGMALAGEYSKVILESQSFSKGPVVYWTVLATSALSWMLAFLGSTAMTFLCSSVFTGITITVIVPFGALLAVLFFHDSFGALKAIAMLLSLWGFASYFYGAHLESKNDMLHTDNNTAAEQSHSNAAIV